MHVNARKRIGIKFTQGNTDANTGTCSWYINIFGDEEAQSLEELLIRKQNWGGIRLAASGTVVKGDQTFNVPPWAGRAHSVPSGKKAAEFDYRRLEVAMGGVHIMRVPSGVGLIK